MRKFSFILISLSLILALQLIALWPSFHLALYGDDWLAFWHLWSNSDPVIGAHYNPVRYFLTAYGPQDMNMGFLRFFFGYDSFFYYSASFIWRLSVSFALFFVTLKLTKNKVAALFAGTFFALSEIGLDATDWVFNMTSYAGLLSYMIFIYFFFTARQNKSIKKVLLASFFLFMAIIIVPIRMHGGLMLLMLAEFLWLVLDRSAANLKYTFIRFVIFTVTVLLIKIIGNSLGNMDETLSRTADGFSLIFNYLKHGQPEILLYLLMSIGYMIIPQSLWSQTNTEADSFFPLSLTIFTTFILLFLFLTPKEQRTKKNLFITMFSGLGYNFIVWLMFNAHMQGFYALHRIGSALIGGYLTILLLSLLINKTFGKEKFVYSAVSIFWPLAFIVFPWITLDTGNAFPEYHRYLIMSSAGVALIWALLGTLKSNKKILILLFVTHLGIQFYATQSYLDYRSQRRNTDVSKKIWSELEKGFPNFDGKKLYIVLFLTDTPDMNYFHGYFGFSPRIAVRNKIRGYRAPNAVTDYNQLISAVTDGKVLKNNGHEERPINPDQTLAFIINGESLDSIRVQNITEQTRKDLKVISDQYLKDHSGVSYQE